MTHVKATLSTIHHFSLPLFLLTVALSLGGCLLALALLAPETWDVQLSASGWAISAVFLVVHLLNAFVEYIFHRYVLHAPLIPFLARFYKQHTLHHGLTRVTKKRVEGEAEWRIENRYPIVADIQNQASFFPWYTFGAFALLATPVFALGQWLLPGAPIFLGGFVALTFSLCLYEIFHALEHRPREKKWNRLLEHPRWGSWWKKVYSFHLRHHADIRSNESISGFFGLPVTDLVFRTYVGTVTLYEHNSVAQEELFKSPTPRFIRWLDRLAEKKKKRLNTS